MSDATTLTKSIYEELGFDTSAFTIVAENPEAFLPTGRTTTLHVGQKRPFSAEVNGMTIEAYVTIRQASLKRLSLLRQQSPYTDEFYHIVSGTFRDVKADISLMIGGTEVSMEEFLLGLINADLPADKQIDLERFIAQATALGMGFGTQWSLLWQHFGADIDGYHKAVTQFQAMGAVDDMPNISEPGRIQEAWVIPDDEPMPRVSVFEVGRQDRSRSQTNQGFLDLADAVITNFSRIVALRKQMFAESKALKESMGDMSEEEVRAARASIDDLRRSSTSWANNLAGANERQEVQPDSSLVAQGIWDSVSAPCGRLTIESPIDATYTIGEGDAAKEYALTAPTSEAPGTEVSMDFWRNSNGTSASGSSTDTPLDETGEAPPEPENDDEAPF